MKKTLALILALLLLGLCGCGSNAKTEPSTEASTEASTEVTTEAATEAVTEPTTEATEETAEETTEAPTEPEIYRNPLSGEILDFPYQMRPYMVSYNNVQAALPHHGIASADIVYEFLTEGGTTRCIALFTNIMEVSKIGSIRSARQYFVDLSQTYDAIFVHAGGSTEALNSLSALGLDHIDAGYYNTFYRDQARLSCGYALEHTLFGSGEGIVSTAIENGYTLNYDEPRDYGILFTEDGTPEGEDAGTVKLFFSNSGKKTSFVYNEETGLYEAFQFNQRWVDSNTGETLSFENILILDTVCYLQSDGVHWTVELTGTDRAGWFACGGKIVPILWSHDSITSNFVYTLEDGTPLELGVGTSYVAMAPVGSTVKYE